MSDAGFIIRVGAVRDEADSMEMLEVVLAGASLELDLAVLFEDRGLACLGGSLGRPWNQLADHDLARLYGFGSSGENRQSEVVVDWIDEHQRNHLLASRRLIEL
jgi:hypothetical protein